MAGSAAAVLVSSAIALLCLYHLLVLPDPAAAARAHRRSGRHRVSSSPSAINTAPSFLFTLGRDHPAIPDIAAFRDKLRRLPADWSGLDAELGPMDRYFGLGPDSPLDVRDRLVYLFAILDHRSPNNNGGVSVADLEAWLRRQAAGRLEVATRREMAKHDKNGDGLVALSEYKEPGKPWGWLHRFATADADADGSLNAAEFNDFLHPQDSSQEEMQLWIVKEKLRELDSDGDRRLSLEEFIDRSHAFDHISTQAHHHQGDDHGLARAQAEKVFRELDADMDNYLTVEEARPVIQSLLTGEFSYATAHAKLLMQEADSDRDGKLSLEEMHNDYISFYDIVYVDDHYDSDQVEVDADFHDEL